MKKLLILIVTAALYFHFYPNAELNDWLLKQKQTILGVFSDATDTRVRLKTEKLFEELSTHFKQFKPNEQSYVAEITRSRDSIKAFYQDYCKTMQASPKLHRDNQAIVCKKIEQFQNLL